MLPQPRSGVASGLKNARNELMKFIAGGVLFDPMPRGFQGNMSLNLIPLPSRV